MERFVSVIIPVFNDAERLKICLTALETQTYPQDCYEEIVVDNGSDESLENIVKQFPQAKLAYCNNPGSYAARNHGISLAKGEILAFTDSDCIPASDWLTMGVKRLVATANCGLVAGKIEIFLKITIAQELLNFTTALLSSIKNNILKKKNMAQQLIYSLKN